MVSRSLVNTATFMQHAGNMCVYTPAETWALQTCGQLIPWQFRRANQIVLTTLLCQSSKFWQLFSLEALKILFLIPLTKCLKRKFSIKITCRCRYKKADYHISNWCWMWGYSAANIALAVVDLKHSMKWGGEGIPLVFTYLWPASLCSARLPGTSSKDSWVQTVPSLQNKTPISINIQTSEIMVLCEIK